MQIEPEQHDGGRSQRDGPAHFEDKGMRRDQSVRLGVTTRRKQELKLWHAKNGVKNMARVGVAPGRAKGRGTIYYSFELCGLLQLTGETRHQIIKKGCGLLTVQRGRVIHKKIGEWAWRVFEHFVKIGVSKKKLIFQCGRIKKYN